VSDWTVLYRILLLIISLSVSEGAQAKSPLLKAGRWRAELTLAPGIILPFQFDLNTGKSECAVTIINAQERIELHNIRFKSDSIFISFPAYDSDIQAKIIGKTKIQGAWFNRAKKDNYHIPLTAVLANDARFYQNFPVIDVEGRWRVTFSDNGQPYRSVGVFEKSRSPTDGPGIIHGTFLTETGDYRYLAGTVSSDSIYLSAFDGSHAFLFMARLKDDTLFGSFHSGIHYLTDWVAVRDDRVELPNPDSLTYVISAEPVVFRLPGLNASEYSYPNDDTRGTVTLIQIMGTWCPNCLDESLYLNGLHKQFNGKIQIIGVSFETPVLLEDKIKRVITYKNALDLGYSFVIGGDANKRRAHEIFPMVNEIMSFPTLIFIDKKGEIRKIHTGFSGPGTGIYYDQFFKETSAFVEALVAE